MLFLCLLLWGDLGVGNWEEEMRVLFYFSSRLGGCGEKRTISSFIEKFGHGGLTVLVS